VVVIDIKFLYGCARPTIAVLYADQREARHIKTYCISGERESILRTACG
jgi:DNA damage-binding protein 1